MYDSQALENLFKKEDVTVYRIHTSGDVTSKGFAFGRIDDFMEFVLQQKIHCVFAYEHYDFIEDYLVTEKIIEEEGKRLKDEFLNELMPQIEQYNKQIEKINFDVPAMILLMCIYESKSFYTILDNNVTNDLIEPKEVFKEICNQNEEKLNEININTKKEIEKLKQELREIVLADNKFLLCTNKDLRMSYAKSLLREKLDAHFQPLKTHWDHYGNGPLYFEAYNFFDMIWNELKQKK